MEIQVSNRKAKFTELKPYCHFAKDHDLIEVTEWSNGEGYDVTIHNVDGVKNFSLSMGEFEALTVLINYRGE
jgi:hypothetical protein